MFKVAVIVGSLRRESINRRFAQALAKLAEGTLEFQFVELGDVPMYNEDLWQDPPPAVTRRGKRAPVAASICVRRSTNSSPNSPLPNGQ